ncbi:MAG TPA: hypothetical protein ENN19_06710 [Chloroflexi bacterium]|nr:hypothetical protein [Chloroflexota bacterium]
MTSKKVQTSWYDENLLVQDAREPFVERIKNTLQVSDMPAIGGLPSEAGRKKEHSYYTYPLLFYTAFPDVSLAQLRSLSLCGSFIFDHILCLDSTLDHPTACDAGTIFLASKLQHEALSLLHGLFPSESTFWNYFNAYYEQFFQTLLHERARHHCLVTPYSEDELRFVYAGKSAVAKGCVAALAILGDRQDLIAPLTASHDAFSVGLQLFDDLLDWQLDYHRSHYSYTLTQAFCEAGWRHHIESDQRPKPEEVRGLLQRSGVIEKILTLSLAYLDEAEAIVEDDTMIEEMDEGSWMAAIRQLRQRIRRFHFDAEPIDESPSTHSSIELSFDSSLDVVATPIAPGWIVWLDHSRVPRVNDAHILAAQHRFLCQSSHKVYKLGETLCQVGLAIASSNTLYPEQSPAEHVGMSEGEMEWCRRNDRWLDAILALSLDEPAQLWTPNDNSQSVTPFPGWMPPAVGRYIGYRLVQNYTNWAIGSNKPTPTEIMRYYRLRLIA